MTRRRYIQIGVGVLLPGVLVWGITKGLERLVAPAATSSNGSPAAGSAPAAVAHITATFFYAAADGQALVPVHREVPLAEGVVPQGREILSMQLEAPPSPYLSPIPDGTMLRAFYVTERGDAFVELLLHLRHTLVGGLDALARLVVVEERGARGKREERAGQCDRRKRAPQLLRPVH